MNENHSNTDQIYEQDLVLKDKIAYKDNKPFSGFASQDCKYIGNSGYKEAKDAIWVKFTYYMPYKNGVKEGVCKAYYENNQLKYESTYENGNKNGLFKSWFQNGKINEEGNYKSGKKNGIWKTWFENDCPESEIQFINDEQIIAKWWFDNYQLKIERNKNGITEDDNMILLSRGWYRNGQLNSETKSIKNNGQIIRTEWHLNGRIEKKEFTDIDKTKYLFERIFYENGLIKSERNYKVGYKKEKHLVAGEKTEREFKFPIKINHGTHKYWFENGKISYLEGFKDNKHHGKHKRWYRNGQLNSESYFVDGKMNEFYKWWDSRGNLKTSKIYKNGRLIEEKGIFKDYYELIFFRFEDGYNKRILEYRKHDGQLLPKSEWPKPNKPNYNESYDSGFNDTYYNDQLDMDQQSPEFWDSL